MKTQNYGSAVEGSNSDDMKISLEEIYEIIGIGRTQICYWIMIVLVIYFDSAEMAAVSTLIPLLSCEWELTVTWETAINLSSYGFSAIGAVFGSLPDIYGRKKVMLVALTCLFISSTSSAFTKSPIQFIITRCLVGVSMGITFPTSIVLCSEITKSRYKEIGTLLAFISFATSVFGVNLAAYLFLHIIGWRWFLVTTSLPLLLCLLLLSLLPESPRYLLVTGKHRQAADVLTRFAKWNGKQLPSNIRIHVLSGEEERSLTDVLSPMFRQELLLISVIMFSDLLIEFGHIVFTPLAMNSNFCGGSMTPPQHTCRPVSQESLYQISIVTSGGVFACILGIALAVFLGRSIVLKISALLLFITSCLLFKCFSKTMTSIFLFLVRFFVNVNELIGVLIIPELFPTTVRNTAISVVTGCGKAGGALGCGLTYVLYYTSPSLVVAMMCAAAACALGCSLLWRTETRGYAIIDTTEEAMRRT